jgi:hypothetical protein
VEVFRENGRHAADVKARPWRPPEAQEVRNPRAGKYTLAVHASGGASAEVYRHWFLQHFTCRLVGWMSGCWVWDRING